MRLTFKLFLLGFLITGCITSQSEPVPSTPTTYKQIIPTATALATLTVMPVSTTTPIATSIAEYPEIKVGLKGEGGVYFTYLEGFVDQVSSLAWSGDGKTLIIASQQKYLVYFDTQSRKVTITPVCTWISSVTVSPDKKTLAAVSAGIGDSASVCFISLETGETISIIKVEKPFIFIGNTQIVYRGEGIFAPDGKTFILNSGGQITLWDFASGNQIKVLFKSDTNFLTSGLFLNPAKNLLFTLSYSVEGLKEPRFLRWDTSTWQLTETFTGGDFLGFSFSPDGETFTPTGRNVNIVHSGNAAELFNFTGSQNLGLYNGELIAYHPSGKYVAIGNRGYTTIYTNKGQFLYLLSGFSPEVLEFSPDDKQLAAGGGLFSSEGLVAIWNNLNFP